MKKMNSSEHKHVSNKNGEMQLVINRNTLQLLSLICPFQITGQMQKTQITFYDCNILNSKNKLYALCSQTTLSTGIILGSIIFINTKADNYIIHK